MWFDPAAVPANFAQDLPLPVARVLAAAEKPIAARSFTDPDGSEGADLFFDPEAFREAFAADVDPETAAVMAATQLILQAVEATAAARP